MSEALKPLLRGGVLWLYEGLWAVLLWLWRLFATVNPRLGKLLSERGASEMQLRAWQQSREDSVKAIGIFCSSAGEYEQAKPLIRRFQSGPRKCFVVIVFTSPSGTRFAASQGETVPYLLAKSDRPSEWQKLMQRLRLDLWIIVRYELWPGFLSVAAQSAPLFLVDGVAADHLERQHLARWIRQQLLRPIARHFLVSAQDQDFYERHLNISGDKLSVTGDTKYDRVLERIEERQSRYKELKAQLGPWLENARVLVLGSAWPADVEAFCSVYPELKKHTPGCLRVMVVPHDLSSGNIQAMTLMLAQFAQPLGPVSQIGFEGATLEHEILMVDVMGYLPELYGCGHLAWVGGAMHYRVHNVLEPACRGLYVCFGPHYSTSQEAKTLVKLELAHVIESGQDFFTWYQHLDFSNTPPHGALWQMVSRNQGASDAIVNQLPLA